MEDFFINIDSRYRDIQTYPNESKFKFTLNRMYKNIISVKFMSIELINTVSYIDTFKNNNYITFHFPNKEQDPIGFVYTFPEGFYNTFNLLANTINTSLEKQINMTSAFEDINRERYFYIFYLYAPVTITITNSQSSYTFIQNAGFYSLHGFVLLLTKFIDSKNLTNFTVASFTLQIWDRRFQTVDPQNPYNNIRLDTIPTTSSPDTNSLKYAIYSEYIADTDNFIAGSGGGILDLLVLNLSIPDTSINYIATTISSNSKYHINSTRSPPTQTTSQLYSLNFMQSPNSTKTILTSKHNPFYYFDATENTWSPTTSNILNSTYDLPTFEINITTLSKSSLGFTYPSIGYYMGFRAPTILSTNNMVMAEKLGNYIGDPYIFVRMNDWGHVDLFNQRFLAKVLLTPDLGLVKLDEFYAKEYKFKQPQNVQSINIELVDYLGNTLDLRGLDFSFTLQLLQINNSDLKRELEYNFFDKKK